MQQSSAKAGLQQRIQHSSAWDAAEISLLQEMLQSLTGLGCCKGCSSVQQRGWTAEGDAAAFSR